MIKNLIKNIIDSREYFVSVVPVQKSISIPVPAFGGIPLGNLDFKNIVLEAAIYEQETIKKFPLNPMPKPVMTVFMDRMGYSKVVTQDIFQSQINDFIKNVDVTSDADIEAKLSDMGYIASIHEIWNLFFLSRLKHVFIFENPSRER